MPIALEVTLIIVLVTFAGALLPLLAQLRRTARSIDAFLLSSQRDLSQIAEDVHVSRQRMDHLAISLQSSLDDFSTFAKLMGDVAGNVKALHRRFQTTFDSTAQIIGGVSAMLGFFKNRSSTTQAE